MTHTAVLSLGSNWGDREEAVKNALAQIQCRLGETVTSEIYFTPPVSGNGADYANCVAAVYTDRDADDICLITKQMETEAGRTPERRERGEVPLDIDLVIFDGDILRPADFTRQYFYEGLLQISGS